MKKFENRLFKFIIAIISCTCFLSAFIFVKLFSCLNINASANNNSLIKDIISEMAIQEGRNTNDLCIEVENLYGANETQIGYNVEFNFKEDMGYAIFLT